MCIDIFVSYHIVIIVPSRAWARDATRSPGPRVQIRTMEWWILVISSVINSIHPVIYGDVQCVTVIHGDKFRVYGDLMGIIGV